MHESVNIYHRHHHHIGSSGNISLTLTRCPSLLPIVSGRSSMLHPVATKKKVCIESTQTLNIKVSLNESNIK